MNEIVIVDAIRTPIGKRNRWLRELHPVSLGAHVTRSLLERNSLDKPAIQSVPRRPAEILTKTLHRRRHLNALLLLMLVAYIFRLALVANGGQFYFPDELRYMPSVVVADNIFAGDYKSAIGSLLQYRLHAGATTARLIPAYLHRLAFAIHDDTGLTWDEYWQNQTADFRFSAIFFALPSVLSIGMIYLIALNAGANQDEALLAAFLLATSNSWFIYSRHFLPYDASLLLGLVALYAVLRLRDSGFKGAMVVGMLLFCSFWVYFTHYFLMFAIAFLFCVLLARKPLDLVLRPLAIFVGASVFLLPILLYSYLILEIDVFDRMQTLGFATVGDYDEGPVLPFLYFRDAEGATSVVWLGGLFLAIIQLIRRRSDYRHRAFRWLACLLFLYLLMSLFSSGLHILALAGRFVRPMIPFIVLISAYAFAPLLKRLGAKLAILLLLALSVICVNNFLAAINQPFYREVARDVLNAYDSVSFESTFSPPARTKNFANPKLEGARYLLVNAGFYHPVTEMTERPAGQVILKVSHPYNFKPFQYEHATFLRRAREIINKDGVFIYLIDTQSLTVDSS